MKCAYHPEVEAVATCSRCGRPVCNDCKTLLWEKVYCNPCANNLFLEMTSQDTAPNKSWFQRHLNWTWVLMTVLGCFVLGFIAGIVIGIVDPYGLSYSDGTIDIIALCIGLVVQLVVGGWVLRQKSRSLWWLLILLIPLGWIIFLFLGNRSDAKNTGLGGGIA